ncbi:glycoside hydrolase family 25 protein [Acetatifactor muris]|uniref:Lysozyme M1 n=1 Tax=Acetatifactor muris TaxID=879566 RepID=A0A2K4ZFB5_9FIRM|nr:GH25 family lysozyme [Acetatifactor muris]MCR2047347.1 glycoside hydrolase family 25 protein [Acetatifactor muris]SOY29152.1 Lysozyme M1 precursor [Acetatifactor muris]
MDSKLRRTAILSSMALILLVSLFVVFSNLPQPGPGREDNTPAQTTPLPEQEGQTEAPEEQKEGQIGNDLSAFLRDNTFFDQEISPILEAAKENAARLSLVVTSVEKDLRIQIVDMQGNPVTGESFYVKLEGEGEYKDLDKDGIIYIGDLAAGEYFVELLPVEGYRVPNNETKVRVKDKVEYVAINDISLLIKTEEEIVAEAEDTAVVDALEDADKTEIKKFQKPTANSQVGIDVSKWNGEIDWDKVKNAGVEFAIIRAGYRGSVTGSLVVDPYFTANMRGAAVSGVPVGVYFFTQAVNEVEAVEEASAVLELIREYNLEYPVFIDTEGAGGNGRADGLDVDTRTLVCEAFCRTIANAGYTAGVYGSRNWYNNNLHAEQLEQYCIWLAEYRSVPLYQGYYQMWQYTSKGSIDGIEGNVDMNVSYLK